MRDDRSRLLDMLEAIQRIERYSGISQEAFVRDELVQTWMVYHLQVIGEAVTRLSEELRARYPNIPWRAIAATRHALVHAYFQVDLDEVLSTVQQDLPVLKARIEAILASDDAGGADSTPLP